MEGEQNMNLHNQNKKVYVLILINMFVDTIIPLDERAMRKAGFECWQVACIKRTINPPAIWTKACKCEVVAAPIQKRKALQ